MNQTRPLRPVALAKMLALLPAYPGSLTLPRGAGHVRVIAGEFAGLHGPARTHSPMNVWDLRLAQGGSTRLRLPVGHTAALVVLRGTIMLNGQQLLNQDQIVPLEREHDELEIEANSDAVLLVLGGEPIDEPIIGRGPFVMNSETEIDQAFADLHSGSFGPIAA